MKQQWRFEAFALVLAVFLGSALLGCAQAESSGSLQGTVTYGMGPSNVSGAGISLLQSSVAKQTATTDGTGQYLFAVVPPGTYDVSASIPNFWVIPGSDCRINGGAWIAEPTPPVSGSGTNPYILTYSGLTVFSGDSITLDFRLNGY